VAGTLEQKNLRLGRKNSKKLTKYEKEGIAIDCNVALILSSDLDLVSYKTWNDKDSFARLGRLIMQTTSQVLKIKFTELELVGAWLDITDINTPDFNETSLVKAYLMIVAQTKAKSKK